MPLETERESRKFDPNTNLALESSAHIYALTKWYNTNLHLGSYAHTRIHVMCVLQNAPALRSVLPRGKEETVFNSTIFDVKTLSL